MASRTGKEKQHVYLSYRDLFSGSKARVRDRKAIRSIVLKHWAQSGVTHDQQHLDKTIAVLQALLKDRVFELETHARRAFPHLFAKSPPLAHAIASSTKHDAASKDAVHTDRKTSKANIKGSAPHVSKSIPTIMRKDDIRTRLDSAPILLPFEAQHHVLSRTQNLLEETCFLFLKRWLPGALIEHNWTCAAAIELTHSLSIIKANLPLLPGECMDSATQTVFKQIAPQIAQLRHSAVHRLHLGHNKFLSQINCARTLAGILQHAENQEILQTLHSHVAALIRKLECKTDIVMQNADRALSQLEEQRVALVQKVQQARDDAAQRHVELAAAAGRAILDALSSIIVSENVKRVDGVDRTADVGDVIDENDIESDEDRLQAELA